MSLYAFTVSSWTLGASCGAQTLPGREALCSQRVSVSCASGGRRRLNALAPRLHLPTRDLSTHSVPVPVPVPEVYMFVRSPRSCPYFRKWFRWYWLAEKGL